LAGCVVARGSARLINYWCSSTEYPVQVAVIAR
jgi:hypothetical protein